MLKIAIPDAADADIRPTLGGESYLFSFNYNTVDQVYRLDIYQDEALVIGSLDLKTGSYITGKYDIPAFNHGELFIARLRYTPEDPHRNNIGIGKPYELIYVSNEEIAEA